MAMMEWKSKISTLLQVKRIRNRALVWRNQRSTIERANEAIPKELVVVVKQHAGRKHDPVAAKYF